MHEATPREWTMERVVMDLLVGVMARMIRVVGYLEDVLRRS
jgi:hypothetical protein